MKPAHAALPLQNTEQEQEDYIDPSFFEDPFHHFHNLHKTRVLLIDDDRIMQRIVKKALGEYCQLIEAGNAGNGIAKYKHFAPDIVFLDLELPDDNGLHILEWIMRNDPGAYVVLFSGHCDHRNVQRAIEHGAKGYIPKPFKKALMMYHICRCPKLH